MEAEETQPDVMRDEKPIEGRRNTRKRRIIIFIIVSLINAALLALLWSQLLTPAQNQSTSGSTQSSRPPDGHPAQDFTAASLSNSAAPAIHLANLKGKPIVLNFWASWCDPCKREAPILQSAWQRVQSQDVIFIGINYQDAQSDALAFLRTYSITYPNVQDPNSSTAINYGVTGVPETVFIDRRGIVVHKIIGELTTQMLQSNIQQIVGRT
ncbi:MAG: hypothetical protein NVSMB27_01740 [Ktedonobacteraceae bacterium]